MRNAVLTIAALLAALAVPALADSSAAPSSGLEDKVPAPPPGGVSVSPDGEIVLSSSLCPALAGIGAAPGADYQPGIDVHGEPVAPADLPSSAPPALATLPIVIDARLAHISGGGLLGHGALFGLITVQGGRAYLNGAPLGTDESALLAAACRKARH